MTATDGKSSVVYNGGRPAGLGLLARLHFLFEELTERIETRWSAMAWEPPHEVRLLYPPTWGFIQPGKVPNVTVMAPIYTETYAL